VLDAANLANRTLKHAQVSSVTVIQAISTVWFKNKNDQGATHTAFVKIGISIKPLPWL